MEKPGKPQVLETYLLTSKDVMSRADLEVKDTFTEFKFTEMHLLQVV